MIGSSEMRIAIVTGASSGMGVEFALQIDDVIELDEIWLIARRKDRLDEVSRKLKRAKGIPIVLNLSQKGEVEKLRNMIADEKPDIKFLVNNAGYGLVGEFAQQEIRPQLDMINLNVTALVEITHCCIPFMKTGSHIIQVGSVFGHLPGVAGWAVYAATKSFVSSFSFALSKELKSSGINVTTVTPAGVKTEFGDVAGAGRFDLVSMGSEPAVVVKKAIEDAMNKRMLSIFGFEAKLSAFLPRILRKETMLKIVSSGTASNQSISNYYINREARIKKDFEKSMLLFGSVLAGKYNKERALKIVSEATQKYADIIPILPYVGGDNQPMMTQRILYAATCLALYRAMKDDGTALTEIGQVIYDSINKEYSTFPKNILTKINKRLLFSDMNKKALRNAAIISQERRFPESGVMLYVEGDENNFDYGLDIIECPIKKFLEKQNAAELTTYICKTDFPVSKANSSGLFRTSTLAEGGRVCDMRWKKNGPVSDIVG